MKQRRPENLTDLLASLGVGPWQAAVRSGCSPTSVRSWLAGTCKMHNEQASKLAKGLKVPAWRILEAAEASRDGRS